MKNFSKIDRYLRGQMADTEHQDFEKELANDSSLKQEFLLQRSEEAALERLSTEYLKKRIQTLQKEKATSQNAAPSKKTLPRNFWLGILAVILITVIGLFLLFPPDPKQNTSTQQQDPIKNQKSNKPSNNNPINNSGKEGETGNTIKNSPNSTQQKTKSSPIALAEDAYKNSYSPEEINLKSGGSQQNNSPLKPAYDALAQKQGSKAIQLAQSFTQDSTLGTDVLEIIGHANFQMKNFAAAATAFQQLVDKQSAMFGEQWQWYLLLSYAAQLPEKKVEYENIARQIEADTQHEFYTKTGSLRNQLKQSGY